MKTTITWHDEIVAPDKQDQYLIASEKKNDDGSTTLEVSVAFWLELGESDTGAWLVDDSELPVRFWAEIPKKLKI